MFSGLVVSRGKQNSNIFAEILQISKKIDVCQTLEVIAKIA